MITAVFPRWCSAETGIRKDKIQLQYRNYNLNIIIITNSI